MPVFWRETRREATWRRLRPCVARRASSRQADVITRRAYAATLASPRRRARRHHGAAIGLLHLAAVAVDADVGLAVAVPVADDGLVARAAEVLDAVFRVD